MLACRFKNALAVAMTMQQRQRLVDLGRAGLLSRGDAQMAELWADLWTAEEMRGIAVQGPVFENEGAGGVAYWDFALLGFDGQSECILAPTSASIPSSPCTLSLNAPSKMPTGLLSNLLAGRRSRERDACACLTPSHGRIRRGPPHAARVSNAAAASGD